MIGMQISANQPKGSVRKFHSTAPMAVKDAAVSTRLMVQALHDEVYAGETHHESREADDYSRQAAAVKDRFAHAPYVAISAGGDNGPAS